MGLINLSLGHVIASIRHFGRWCIWQYVYQPQLVAVTSPASGITVVLLGYSHLQPGHDPLGLGEDLGVGEAVDGATAHRPAAELGEEVAHEGPQVPGLFPGSLGEEGVI